jgi:hypothetical protein
LQRSWIGGAAKSIVKGIVKVATSVKEVVLAIPSPPRKAVAGFILVWVFLWVTRGWLWAGFWAVPALHSVLAALRCVFFKDGYDWRVIKAVALYGLVTFL